MATPAAKRPVLKGTMMDRLRRAFSAKDEAGFEEAMSQVEITAEEQEQADLASMIGETVASAIGPAIAEALAPVTARLDDVDAYVTDRKTKDAAAETEADEEKKRKEAETKDASAKDGTDELLAFLRSRGLQDVDLEAAMALLTKKDPVEPVATTDDSMLANPEPDGSNDPGSNGTNTFTSPAAAAQGSTGPGTTDSTALLAAFRDTVAKAEILAPGVKLPSFDAKAKPVSTNDAICGLRRRALKSAFDSADRKAHVVPFLDSAAPDFSKMTCDAVKHVFAGASTLASRANAPTLRTADALPAFDRGVVRDSVVTMQGAADDLWKHAK